MKAGLGARYVSDILDGAKRSITGDKGQKLAEALGTTIEWLTEGRKPQEQIDQETAKLLRIWSDIKNNDELKKLFLDYGEYLTTKKK